MAMYDGLGPRDDLGLESSLAVGENLVTEESLVVEADLGAAETDALVVVEDHAYVPWSKQVCAGVF
jgi:hypothetical protein